MLESVQQGGGGKEGASRRVGTTRMGKSVNSNHCSSSEARCDHIWDDHSLRFVQSARLL